MGGRSVHGSKMRPAIGSYGNSWPSGFPTPGKRGRALLGVSVGKLAAAQHDLQAAGGDIRGNQPVGQQRQAKTGDRAVAQRVHRVGAHGAAELRGGLDAVLGEAPDIGDAGCAKVDERLVPRPLGRVLGSPQRRR